MHHNLNGLSILQARPVPSTHAELIEYFLSTEGGEMQFETARMRPMVTDEFFDFLSKQISEPFPLRIQFQIHQNYRLVLHIATHSSRQYICQC